MRIARLRWLAALFALFAAAPVPAAKAATAAQVDESIRKAIAALYSSQHDGTWETVPAAKPWGGSLGGWDSPDAQQWGGLTSIATYALLSSGENPLDSRIQHAADFLRRATLKGTYAISMRAQVWPLLPTSHEVKEAAHRDAQLLLQGAKTKGDARAMWFYGVDEPKEERGDHSASQMAVLGVWACEEAGVEIPDGFWQLEDTTWRQHQSADGSWAYVYHDTGAWGKPYLSMTVAGLATLFITQDKLIDARRAGGCVGRPADAAVDKGMAWVAENFPSNFNNPGPRAFIPLRGRSLYLLFGLQRLGVASGRRNFGAVDWFRAGSDFLVKTQNDDGGWGSTTWETAFGLLFLARGRAPVAFDKLAYDPGPAAPTAPGASQPAAAPRTKAAAAGAHSETSQAWNERPRDMANLTAWTSKQMERRLNWQVVDASSDPADWLDAPVLYLGGSDAPNLADDQMLKLRAYVEAGGTIVGNADCGNAKFAAGFRALGARLFPAYEFRELPAGHPIYTRQQFPAAKWPRRVSLQGLSNGVRELMLLFPDADPARAWQAQGSTTRSELFAVASDIYLYAVGADHIRVKGDGYFVAPDPAIHADRTIKVARLKYGGNWDPEPGGWRQLAAVMHNQRRVDLSVETVDLSAGKLDSSFKAAHLTGTTRFTLNDHARQQLRSFVEGGGTIVTDAAGGSSDFTTALNEEMAKVFPGVAAAPIESDSPILTAPMDIQKPSYRRFNRILRGTTTPPRLIGLQAGARLAVIESSLDLSAGLVGSGTDGINGYEPAWAASLLVNILTAAGTPKP